MTPWFLRDPERLASERTGVAKLVSESDWLVGAEWGLEGGLYLDAVIRAHCYDYEVRICFPSLYPDAPITVRPRNIDVRISTHQYGGADGPLCLEWGPDNWHGDITAVQMLESAYRLFNIENPLGQERPEVPVTAQSRHELTLGQQLRGELVRWYCSVGLSHFLKDQAPASAGSFEFSSPKSAETWVVWVHGAKRLDGDEWSDDLIPSGLPDTKENDRLVGIWFQTDLEAQAINSATHLSDLRALLVNFGGSELLARDGSSPIAGFANSVTGVLIVDQTGEMHLFLVLSKDNLVTCAKVASDGLPLQFRSPDSDLLKERSIGIVGLGSVGSKIAIALVRMGVRNFYLVDHDVLLPENLQRHALDWQGITQHKAIAVKDAISRLALNVTIETSCTHLTGQESNASVSGVLDRLSQCDLIIDATASPKAFNLISAIVRTSGRIMVWGEVLGGGIGGLICRSRPNIDPPPHEMRAAYLQFCVENPYDELRLQIDYSSQTEGGEVMVASDAEVAIIAHHLARFVPDCFRPNDQARFPYSMYLIGLASGWVFEAPFATIPISTASFSMSGWKTNTEGELGRENIDFLVGLLEKRNETDPAA